MHLINTSMKGDIHSVLVVDGEEAFSIAMRDYFKLRGYRTDCAQGRAEAEALLAQGCYTVLITDICLAGFYNLEGLEVVRQARKQCPQTRIIVLTAYETAEIKEAARCYGVEAFLRKPKPLPEIAQIVYGFVGSAV